MHRMLCSARNHAVPGEEVNTLSRLYRDVKAPQTGKQTHSHAKSCGMRRLCDFWANLGGKDIVFACDNKI